MGVDLGVFNPDKFDEPTENNFECLPAGDYKAVILGSEEKFSNSGNCSFIVFTVECLDDDFIGRRFWSRHMIQHEDPKNDDFCQANYRVIAAIGRACGFGGEKALRDTEQLHEIPVILSVKVKKGKNGYGDSNEIVNARKIDSAPAGRLNPAPTADASKKAWRK